MEESWQSTVMVIARSCMHFLPHQSTFYLTSRLGTEKTSVEMVIVVAEESDVESHKIESTLETLKTLYPNLAKVSLKVVTVFEVQQNRSLQEKISDEFIYVLGKNFLGKI